MNNLENTEITDFITIDTFNDTSLFALSIIDLSTFELVYANQAMKNIMVDINAKNCWEAKYGQKTPCMWCKAHDLLSNSKLNKVNNGNAQTQPCTDDNYVSYENFNETANRWYQIQENIIILENSQKVLISIAIDISMQKEVQSQLINSHVQLTQKTRALEEAKEKLKIQANKDPLTNLYNRRYFQEFSYELINIAKRERIEISVIMLDIDKFKSINDAYGHAVGDEVIKCLASLLLGNTRDSDVVARFGGEEFAILLPHTDKEGAYQIASKLRDVVENQIVRIDDDINIQFTISLGVDSVDIEKDNKVDKALNNADKALYIAKESGRNRVVVN
ncbi:MAG: GGDEF domain-containing protein [Pseudomonadota bacterium]